ncbi:MAG TPA: hypothetical protein VK145_01850 [Candidatus Nanoarchaeia archaeon]|nr:hypothetical protein [Candidatus Nanoarchaeia archaeon]
MNHKRTVLIVIGLLVIFVAVGVTYSRNKNMDTSSNSEVNVNQKKANSLFSTGVQVGDITYRLENFESIEQARLIAVQSGQEIWSRGFSSYAKDPRDYLMYTQLNTEFDIDNIYIGIRYFDPAVQSSEQYREVYYQIDRNTGTVVKELDFPPVYQ